MYRFENPDSTFNVRIFSKVYSPRGNPTSPPKVHTQRENRKTDGYQHSASGVPPPQCWWIGLCFPFHVAPRSNYTRTITAGSALYRGNLRMLTRTSLGSYGRATRRSIGPPWERCVFSSFSRVIPVVDMHITLESVQGRVRHKGYSSIRTHTVTTRKVLQRYLDYKTRAF